MTATHLVAAPVDERDDADLMACVVSGSGEAFDELYDRYRRQAYRVAWSVCRDPGRTEEAVQDAFDAVWRGRATYHGARGAVAPWLLSLVRYRAIDIARANARHASRRATDDALHLYVAPGHDVLEQIVAKDDAAELRAQLARLPELQLEVIMLAYYGQLSHSEIAAELNLAAGTVKGRMRLGMKKLRAEAASSKR